MRKKEETVPLRVDDGRRDDEMIDRTLFWPSSDSRGITIDDPPIHEQLDRLLDCIETLELVRDDFKELDSARCPDELDTPDAGSPWNDVLRRHMEKRHQLLGQALAALIETVTCEVRFCAGKVGLLPELPPE
jgi:hypothetical protein